MVIVGNTNDILGSPTMSNQEYNDPIVPNSLLEWIHYPWLLVGIDMYWPIPIEAITDPPTLGPPFRLARRAFALPGSHWFQSPDAVMVEVATGDPSLFMIGDGY